MNRALWTKSWHEARWLLLGCAALMFGFLWLRVWLSSLFSTRDLRDMLSYAPQIFEKLNAVSFAQVATSTGRIAVAYDDPVVLLLVTVWAISRGSDAVSGELNRGTMEMVLAQPVSRTSVLATQSLVTLLGAMILACVAWLGTTVGLRTVTLEDVVSPLPFVAAALNVFSLTAFLAGLTTLVSACSNYRSRTIGVVGTVYALSMIIKIVGRLAPGWHWLGNLSFFTPFEPQRLVSNVAARWSFWVPVKDSWELGGLGYDGVLVGLGLAAYVAAGVVFNRRDVPAPL